MSGFHPKLAVVGGAALRALIAEAVEKVRLRAVFEQISRICGLADFLSH
jgi:hypothetical protein